jgi:hypothetical protein
MGHGVTRHGQPKANVDEQPAGATSGGRDDVASALLGSATSARLGALPKLGDASSD